MESSILMLHHHCKHTSQQCITFMVIYRALHSELEHFIIIPCSQHYPRHSSNKPWAGMFQTSLVNQSLVLSSLAIHKFCDECRQHLSSSCCDLNSMRTWSPSSFFSRHTHPCTIYPCLRYTHLVILHRFLSSTSIFFGVIDSCHLWWVNCFSSIKSLSSWISGRDSF
jgi:hypothetical protein